MPRWTRTGCLATGRRGCCAGGTSLWAGPGATHRTEATPASPTADLLHQRVTHFYSHAWVPSLSSMGPLASLRSSVPLAAGPASPPTLLAASPTPSNQHCKSILPAWPAP